MYVQLAQALDVVNHQNFVIANESIQEEELLLKLSTDEYYTRLNTWLVNQDKKAEQYEKIHGKG